MANLYIVGTPIGNLGDIAKRALDILKSADLILCEDTRVTRKLLCRYEIKTKTVSYHQYSKLKKVNYILELLRQGKNLALVSDAGTPGVSDPGNKLVEAVVEEFGDKVGIIPIPGPSAISAAASISGFSMDRFLFLGFPPHKKKRKKFFEEAVESKYPVVLFESPYRILKTLKELKNTDQELRVMAARELTKKFETVYRGKIDEVISKIESKKPKGEFVIIIKKS